ncbi:MAG: sulfite oxidase heme-binding subunit YedZ [Burkholderiaceae bacterium]|jgi:sulfoxide reductase heme-binding subunit YedZ
MSLPVPGVNVWTQRDISRFKPLLFLLCLYPLGRWIWLGYTGGLGVNPPEFLIRSTGIWALVVLLLTLAVTPVRRLVHQPALVTLRRMLGLFAFFYTVLHVAGWAWWEANGSLSMMLNDILDRTFILLGALAVVPMTLLAITSTRGWIRRLGRNWQRLHQTVYAVAVLSVWHFWLLRTGKNDVLEPYIYGLVLAVLLLFRLVWRFTAVPSGSPVSGHRPGRRGAPDGSASGKR